MKNLIKLSMIVCLSFMWMQSSAQTFGVKAGLNLSTMLEKDDYGTYSDFYSMNPGFHVGATFDLPITNFLSFEPGVLFTTKGFKFKIPSLMAIATFNFYYLDIPLNIKASHDFGEGIKVFAATGPYVGMGLFGNMKFSEEGGKEVEPIEMGSNGNFKRIDMGLTFGGGVEVKSVTLGVSYDYGLSNISSDTDYGHVNKNRVLRISAGYRFGK